MRALLACGGLLFAQAAFAQGASLEARPETFGGVVAPAVLPGGAASAYGFVGAPEVGGGYRQGLRLAEQPFELEGNATLNYLLLSLRAEVVARYLVYQQGIVEVAPLLGLGVELNTGARYYDGRNFSHIGLRPKLGAVASFQVAEIVRALAVLEVPYTFAFGGGYQFTPLAGGGAEIYLNSDLSGLVLGKLGVDIIKQPFGVPQTTLGWQLMLGVGYRLF